MRMNKFEYRSVYSTILTVSLHDTIYKLYRVKWCTVLDLRKRLNN